MQNQRLDPTGIANPGNTCRLMGTGPILDRQEAARCVSGKVWNRNDPFFQSEHGPLAGNLDPLVAPDAHGCRNSVSIEVHIKAEIQQAVRCTWSPWWCEHRDVLGDCTRTSLVMRAEALIQRTWWSVSRWLIGWHDRCWVSMAWLVSSQTLEDDKLS